MCLEGLRKSKKIPSIKETFETELIEFKLEALPRESACSVWLFISFSHDYLGTLFF